ncbi:hypothetical protein GWQ43_13905 [Alcaligenes faecalis]|uniref:YceD family protein n=1 Tax=Alcaligenes faecalis TaxID=511 RepID=UPI00137C2E13|nr:YceD family protein [Alcaligenes faecalis]QHS37088.1 hypothetical protein GWQ43_13905 [Alcaligenes faecalis]
MTTQYIDTLNLARAPQEMSGQVLVEDLSRLVSDLPDQGDLRIDWSVSGREDSARRRFVHVQAKGSVILECQRCVKPFEWPIDISNEVQIVATEEELELDDDDTEGPDRILCEGQLDVLGLVEDELILSVPYVPRHEVCPDTQSLSMEAKSDDLDESAFERPSPFAVLGSLKKS